MALNWEYRSSTTASFASFNDGKDFSNAFANLLSYKTSAYMLF
jgi:hypothetical protein